jgi:hypothetical protein
LKESGPSWLATNLCWREAFAAVRARGFARVGRAALRRTSAFFARALTFVLALAMVVLLMICRHAALSHV